MKLFTPFTLGQNTLDSRITMAPMTRSRTDQPGNIPNALMAKYYAQRASAGLIITEATQISPQGQGYSFTPGIHTRAQIEGWKKVTGAVHQQGGTIFQQLWHVGRMSHPSFHNGELPVAPSALDPQAQVWLANEKGNGAMVDCPTPRALTKPEITQIVEDYRQAARNSLAAGFDGVEIHGANGYLIDQFLRTTSNHRTDEYGGSIENRARFLLEVVEAVAEVAGPERTGIRLAPYITARGMNCPEIIQTILYVAEKLNALGVSFIHLAEADWDDAPTVPESFRHTLRQSFSGAIIVAGGYTEQSADAILSAGLADLVAFGRPFIANPDLPERLKNHWPLAELRADKLFGGGAEGYSDYPFYTATESAPA